MTQYIVEGNLSIPLQAQLPEVKFRFEIEAETEMDAWRIVERASGKEYQINSEATIVRKGDEETKAQS